MKNKISNELNQLKSDLKKFYIKCQNDEIMKNANYQFSYFAFYNKKLYVTAEFLLKNFPNQTKLFYIYFFSENQFNEFNIYILQPYIERTNFDLYFNLYDKDYPYINIDLLCEVLKTKKIMDTELEMYNPYSHQMFKKYEFIEGVHALSKDIDNLDRYDFQLISNLFHIFSEHNLKIIARLKNDIGFKSNMEFNDYSSSYTNIKNNYLKMLVCDNPQLANPISDKIIRQVHYIIDIERNQSKLFYTNSNYTEIEFVYPKYRIKKNKKIIEISINEPIISSNFNDILKKINFTLINNNAQKIYDKLNLLSKKKMDQLTDVEYEYMSTFHVLNTNIEFIFRNCEAILKFGKTIEENFNKVFEDFEEENINTSAHIINQYKSCYNNLFITKNNSTTFNAIFNLCKKILIELNNYIAINNIYYDPVLVQLILD